MCGNHINCTFKVTPAVQLSVSIGRRDMVVAGTLWLSAETEPNKSRIAHAVAHRMWPGQLPDAALATTGGSGICYLAATRAGQITPIYCPLRGPGRHGN